MIPTRQTLKVWGKYTIVAPADLFTGASCKIFVCYMKDGELFRDYLIMQRSEGETQKHGAENC